MQRNFSILIFTVFSLAIISSCSLFGDKKNSTVDDVFKQGKVDPNLIFNSVSYVPVYPFFNNIQKPIDVFIGYDELVYVIAENDENTIDDNELLVYDQRGQLSYRMNIKGATDVTQDRRLHTYVLGRAQRPGGPEIVAAVFHIADLGLGKPVFVDTLIHFLCDESRTNSLFRGDDDVAVQFTGIASLFDNTVYVTRTGPRNDPSLIARPDNGILVFDKNGVNIGYAAGLNPNESSLRSSVGISSIATFAAPPQKLMGFSTSKSFYITLADQNKNLEFRAISINAFDDPDVGTVYSENSSLLNFDKTKADRFLYESFRFKKPEDCFVSPDINAYTFVVDSETDSVYVFNSLGFEGVNPPPNSTFKKQVIVSFGGAGKDGLSSGPFNLKDPSGVCYYNRTLFIADKSNNRICRYRLNTDLQ